ncbi:MAG: DoxX family protein [Phycisphaerae bacterium]
MAADKTSTNPCCGQGNNRMAVSLGLLLLRLALGWIFLFHGSQKLFGAFGGPGIEGFAGYLKDLPLLPPVVWAYMAALGEFVGGLCVLLGLLTRLGAIPLIVTMLVAIATVHGPHGFSREHMGYEYNIALIGMAAALVLTGPGLVSLDALLFRRGLFARGPQPI